MAQNAIRTLAQAQQTPSRAGWGALAALPSEIKAQILSDALDCEQTFGRFRRARGKVPQLLEVSNHELRCLSMKIWLEQNDFVLSALPIPYTAHSMVKKRNLICKNDVEASIQWVTYMVVYTPFIKANIVCTENPCRIVPFFFDIMKSVHQDGLRVTINGTQVRAPSGPLGHRGFNFQFQQFPVIHDLLLNLLGLAYVARDIGLSLAQLEHQYKTELARKKCTDWRMKPFIFRNIKRYKLPFDVVAYEGPLDLLYPNKKTALLARRRVDKGHVAWANGATPCRNTLTRAWVTRVLDCLQFWYLHLSEHLTALELAAYATPDDLPSFNHFMEVPFAQRFNQSHPLYGSLFTELPMKTVFECYGSGDWARFRSHTVSDIPWHIVQCKDEMYCVRRHYDAMRRLCR